MINVGVIGLGMMGLTHLDVYGRRDDVKIVAISDLDPDRLSGNSRAAGNVEGQAQGGTDLSHVKRYPDGMAIIEDPDVQLVDICLPTPLHRRFAEAALASGKHVLIEKPLANNFADAQAIARAAEKAQGMAMVAMCMRFWPGWDWLKQAITERRFGAVRAAHFRRLASHPGGPFYSDGRQSGGAILDLHIHDTDFVQHCFGMPAAVYSRGYTAVTGEPDHVVTHYLYKHADAQPLIVAEGGWVMAPGFNFRMEYIVNFEQATAVYDLAAKHPLTVHRAGKSEPVELPAGMGYDHEIAYFLDCIRTGRRPTRVTVAEAAESVKIVDAERRSVQNGEKVSIDQ
jgi:predicted dehydrogenase